MDSWRTELEECNDCQHTKFHLIEISVSVWINIFLNNYTKELNDITFQANVGSSSFYDSERQKRRKLATFNSYT